MTYPEYISSALSAFRPPERLTVSEWADKYRVLSEKDTAFCILYDIIIRMSFFLFFRYKIPLSCSGISVRIYYTYSHLPLTQQAFHLYRKAA